MFFVIFFILAVNNMLPPFFIIKIPFNSFLNTISKNIAAIKRKLGVPELDVLPYSSLKNEGWAELLEVIAGCLAE